MDTVKRFLVVFEIYIQLPIPLCTLLKYIPQCEDLILISTPLAKSSLFASENVINSLGDTLYNDFSNDFSWHRQKGDSTPVITITLDPFFGILVITLLLQSDGISSCSQIFVNKGVRIVAASSGSALNSIQHLNYHGQELFHSSGNLWLG